MGLCVDENGCTLYPEQTSGTTQNKEIWDMIDSVSANALLITIVICVIVALTSALVDEDQPQQKINKVERIANIVGGTAVLIAVVSSIWLLIIIFKQ